MSEELKPCPCGEIPNAGYMGWIDDEEGYGFVECHAKGLSVVIHARTEAEAREAWNRRTEPTDAVPTVGEVELSHHIYCTALPPENAECNCRLEERARTMKGETN